MIPRKPLTPNNRTVNSLQRELASGAFSVKYPKSNERSTIFHYLRPGRQNGEGFGGGSKVGH
jgi:hypothetical protein